MYLLTLSTIFIFPLVSCCYAAARLLLFPLLYFAATCMSALIGSSSVQVTQNELRASLGVKDAENQVVGPKGYGISCFRNQIQMQDKYLNKKTTLLLGEKRGRHSEQKERSQRKGLNPPKVFTG